MATGIFKLRDQLQGLIQKAWTGSQTTPAVEYLVVAGGGAGGAVAGGGGGAGGLLQGIVPVTAGSAITVTVGGGGTGASTTYTSPVDGANGANSVFGSVTAVAGGGGGAYSARAGKSGGSGGGGGQVGGIGGAGTFGQGNSGITSTVWGSGGGGAGTVGLVANGGAGIASSINGTLTTYAGGGGGGGDGTGGGGGVGGGGAGGTGGGGAGTNGTANTGGGGGGAGGTTATSGSGGSGIVIISYPDTYNAPATLTGTYTAGTSGSGSMYFNGSNYMAYGGQSQFAFGTGAFTIEFWLYQPSLVGSICLDFRPATGVNGAYGSFELNTNGQLNYYANSAYQISSNTGVLVAGTWQHIALARSGTSTKLFVNGTQVGSTYSDSTNYSVGSTAPYIGAGAAANALLTGYISNLRIVKGTAVYTSNFTVPTAPLTAITNTSLLLNMVSGSLFADASGNAFVPPVWGLYLTWNQASPFATGLGYKNRVYTWTGSGTVTF